MKSTTISFLPRLFLVNIRVNYKFYENRILPVLGEAKMLSTNKIAKQIGKNEKLAGMSKVNAYRYQRTDSAGFQQADSGKKVFEGMEISASLSEILTCLKQIGYGLSSATSSRKKFDNSVRLELAFEEGKKFDPQNFPEGIEGLLETVLQRKYQHVHIWENKLPSSVTVNVSHPVETDAGILRLTKSGKKIECTIPETEKAVA